MPFESKKQYQLHFSIWRCCAECLWWSYCLSQDSSQVIMGDIILGGFWQTLHFAGRLRCMFVSRCHVDHLELILCTAVSCLIALILCAEHSISVVFNLADSFLNASLLSFFSSSLASWYWHLWWQCLVLHFERQQPPLFFPRLWNASTLWKL
jgi:hypothetical protein